MAVLAEGGELAAVGLIIPPQQLHIYSTKKIFATSVVESMNWEILEILNGKEIHQSEKGNSP